MRKANFQASWLIEATGKPISATLPTAWNVMHPNVTSKKGEFFVHGFTLAMTAQNRFYRPISEQDTQAGYVDIFLCPMLDIYSDMKHSYIVELKYAKYRDSENRVEELRQEAIAQANRYADTDTVKQAIGSTQLHKIVVVYKGMEMRVCEEL